MEGQVQVTLFEELFQIFAAGGFVMPFLALAAIMLWLGVGYRAMTLRRGTRESVRGLVQRALHEGVTSTHGYVDAAAQAAVETRRRFGGDIRGRLDEDLFALESTMSRYRTLVRTIVLVAPLAGLLGTVAGMIEMFQSLGSQTFYSQSGGVANGISQALLTTQFGLMIAIPGMIVGRLLDMREQHMRDDIEQMKEILSNMDMVQLEVNE
mgnify:CR=1 FL=1